MTGDDIRTVGKSSKILFGETLVDFPFQKNIHQLPKQDFIDCLYDLYFKEDAAPTNFKEMVYARFGRSIAEKFLVPYNEKLYACDLSELDVDAMGRFFPYADLDDIIRNFRQADNHSYNATFTYPSGGAIRYVEALAHDVPDERILLNTGLTHVDLARKVATTSTGQQIRFEYLISSAPFDQFIRMTDLDVDLSVFRANQVLVFNLGFDRKGWRDVHWVYFPERKYAFYRIGFYDNIFDTDRMSLYVEIGAPTDVALDVAANRQRVLDDLRVAGVITDHELVSEHTVTLNPAYVHINSKIQHAVQQLGQVLAARGVYSLGRYGGWTYCSIEDNIVEARELTQVLNTLPSAIDA